jgi:Methyltransferase domain
VRAHDLRPTEARWLAKAAIQGVLSYVPRGRELNHYLQRHVSKRLPRSERDFDWHAQMGVEHLQALDRVRPGVDRSALRCYEFGGGWDLIAALSLWAMGVEHQTVIDINPNVALDLVNDTVRRFATDGDRLERVLGVRLRRPDESPIGTVEELVTRFGISYLAPQDARAMPLEDSSVDFVTNTFTLEHIPPADIAAILGETRRIMAPGALISSRIDMQDHYHYVQPSISVYNYLRFPGWQWRWLNPPLHSQNRLRHSQYVQLFEQSGFEIAWNDPATPTTEDLAELRRIPIAPQFDRFTVTDLGTKYTHMVAQPAP